MLSKIRLKLLLTYVSLSGCCGLCFKSDKEPPNSEGERLTSGGPQDLEEAPPKVPEIPRVSEQESTKVETKTPPALPKAPLNAGGILPDGGTASDPAPNAGTVPERTLPEASAEARDSDGAPESTASNAAVDTGTPLEGTPPQADNSEAIEEDKQIREVIAACSKFYRFSGQPDELKNQITPFLNEQQNLFRESSSTNLHHHLQPGQIFLIMYWENKVWFQCLVQVQDGFLRWVDTDLRSVRTSLNSHKSFFSEFIRENHRFSIDDEGRIGRPLSDNAVQRLKDYHVPDKVEYFGFELLDHSSANVFYGEFLRKKATPELELRLDYERGLIYMPQLYLCSHLMLVWKDSVGNPCNLWLMIQPSYRSREFCVAAYLKAVDEFIELACDIRCEDGLDLNNLPGVLGSEKTTYDDGSWECNVQLNRRNGFKKIGVNSSGDPFSDLNCDAIVKCRPDEPENCDYIAFTVTEFHGQKTITCKKELGLTDAVLMRRSGYFLLTSNATGKTTTKERFNEIISSNLGTDFWLYGSRLGKNDTSQLDRLDKYFIFFVKVGDEYKPVFGVRNAEGVGRSWYVVRDRASIDLQEALGYSDELLALLDEQNKPFMRAILEYIRYRNATIKENILDGLAKGRINLYALKPNASRSYQDYFAKRSTSYDSVTHEQASQGGFWSQYRYFVLDNVPGQPLEWYLPAFVLTTTTELTYGFFGVGFSSTSENIFQSHAEILKYYIQSYDHYGTLTNVYGRIGIEIKNWQIPGKDIEVSMLSLDSCLDPNALKWKPPEHIIDGTFLDYHEMDETFLFSKTSTVFDARSITKYVKCTWKDDAGFEQTGIFEKKVNDEHEVSLADRTNSPITLQETIQLMFEAGMISLNVLKKQESSDFSDLETDLLKYFDDAKREEFFDPVVAWGDFAGNHIIVDNKSDNESFTQPCPLPAVIYAKDDESRAWIYCDSFGEVVPSASLSHASLMGAFAIRNSYKAEVGDVGLYQNDEGKVGLRIVTSSGLQFWALKNERNVVVNGSDNSYEVIGNILYSKTRNYFAPSDIRRLSLSWNYGPTALTLELEQDVRNCDDILDEGKKIAIIAFKVVE